VAATVLQGARPQVWHQDHSRPERPVTRSLAEELALIIRGRAVNPKWITGALRHGYKGAAEIAATVDYAFAFAATTGAISHDQFEALFQAYLGDTAVCEAIGVANPAALREIADRFAEAIERGLWQPRANTVIPTLERVRAR
jgi:cobaltochelatase CobN